MLPSNRSWQCLGAYLYVLGLDSADLAWEYLRRNVRYRRTWQDQPAEASACAAVWGLRALEDPSCDARIAHPLWRHRPAGTATLCHADEDAGAARFNLWGWPARKTLLQDRRCLHIRCSGVISRMRLAAPLDVTDGMPYGFSVSATPHLHRDWSTVQIAAHFVAGRDTTTHPSRFRRESWTHVLTLQALDADQAGASQREMAHTLFGPSVSELWTPDSAMRAQIRYLLRRGRHLSERGYRSLVGLDSGKYGETT